MCTKYSQVPKCLNSESKEKYKRRHTLCSYRQVVRCQVILKKLYSKVADVPLSRSSLIPDNDLYIMLSNGPIMLRNGPIMLSNDPYAQECP